MECTNLVFVEGAPVQILHALAEADLRDLVIRLQELSELIKVEMRRLQYIKHCTQPKTNHQFFQIGL